MTVRIRGSFLESDPQWQPQPGHLRRGQRPPSWGGSRTYILFRPQSSGQMSISLSVFVGTGGYWAWAGIHGSRKCNTWSDRILKPKLSPSCAWLRAPDRCCNPETTLARALQTGLWKTENPDEAGLSPGSLSAHLPEIRASTPASCISLTQTFQYVIIIN